MGQTDRQLIAVIDDEPHLLGLYKASLHGLGDVHTFSSPESFLQKMKEDPGFVPDLIITDYSMPTMTGIQLLESIQNLSSTISTILLSGYLDKEKCIAAANAGVTQILEKPVVRGDLISMSMQMLLLARHRNNQKEISKAMQQLKEMFLVFQNLCINELDIQAVRQPAVFSAAQSSVQRAESLEQELLSLENHLQVLSELQGELFHKLEKAHPHKKAI